MEYKKTPQFILVLHSFAYLLRSTDEPIDLSHTKISVLYQINSESVQKMLDSEVWKAATAPTKIIWRSWH